MKFRNGLMIIGAMFALSFTTSAQQQSGAVPSVALAESTYKNILVLRGLPAADLMRTMHLIRASLGTRCDHCHDIDHYEADVKPGKATARRMIRMVLDLNAGPFGGKTVVTCNTCHRGALTPTSVPPVTQGLFPDTTTTPASAAEATTVPTVSEIINRYVTAAGGRQALEALKSRTAEGTVLRSKLVRGEGRAYVVNRGLEDPVLVRVTASGDISLTIGSGAAAATQTVRDAAGLVRSGTAERPMTSEEVESLAARVGLRRELILLDQVQTFTVLPTVDVDGQRMNVIERPLSSGRRERLYFDAAKGLLRRRLILSPTPVGDDPQQTDYEDYRTVDGASVPYVVKQSYLDDNHYGTTLRFTVVRHNTQ